MSKVLRDLLREAERYISGFEGDELQNDPPVDDLLKRMRDHLEVPQFDTRDVGLAIRDALEHATVTHFEEVNDDLVEDPCRDEVAFVDVSDPHNLEIHLDNGQTFTVRIFAGPK